ncbi:MAG: hypothetical protein WD049_04695 [Candidatus Paceibacterota bacterium]
MPEDIAHPLRPKFLDEVVIHQIIDAIAHVVMDEFPIKRNTLHVVVLAPQKLVEGEYPNCSITPYIAGERSYYPEEWTHNFKDIARSKANQLWYGQNDGGCEIQPHLLCSGDTPNWGGVKRKGIVVACSGVEPYFDRMISGMVADGCIAMARDNWETGGDKVNKVDSLT